MNHNPRINNLEAFLCLAGSSCNYAYSPVMEKELLQELFRSLTGYNNEYWRFFFPNGIPSLEENPVLSKAQGSVDGAEYLPSHRGKPCGHIMRKGEAVYRCKQCSLDDTCVLCARCFQASNHEGHEISMSIEKSNGGCCDCGDLEAWKTPVCCSIHSLDGSGSDPLTDSGKYSQIPEDLKRSIRSTIARVLNFMLDVLSCSPENFKLPATSEDVRIDERASRLHFSAYGLPNADTDPAIYTTVLWNDEKHSFDQVIHQVRRATGCERSFAEETAQKVDALGRFAVAKSSDIYKLLQIAKLLDHIKLAVTIRSARDVFREELCGTIIEWLKDIVMCTVGDDASLLRTIVCEELCGEWRRGSDGSNAGLGLHGLAPAFDSEEEYSPDDMSEDNDDVDMEGEGEPDEMDFALENLPTARPANSSLTVVENSPDVSSDTCNKPKHKSVHPDNYWSNPNSCEREGQMRLDWYLLFDLRLWKKARISLRELYINSMVVNTEFKKVMGVRFAIMYTKLARAFLIADREPDHSIIHFSVQIFTTPSIAKELVTRYNFFTKLSAILYTFYTRKQVEDVDQIDLDATIDAESTHFKSRRAFLIFHDIQYLLKVDAFKPILQKEVRFLKQFLDVLRLFQGMNKQKRASIQHVEFESDSWNVAFNISFQLARLCDLLSDAFTDAQQVLVNQAFRVVLHRTILWSTSRDSQSLQSPSGSNFSTLRYINSQNQYAQPWKIVEFDVSKLEISFHHPLHWLLASLLQHAAQAPDVDLLMGNLNNLQEISPNSRWLTELSIALGRDFYDLKKLRNYLLALVVDFPLRVCVLQAQIRENLWVRNGMAMQAQNMHYRVIDIREYTVDKDLMLLQFALATLEPDHFLLTLLDRFDICGWLFTDPWYSTNVHDDHRHVAMLEEVLFLVIVLFSERSKICKWTIQQQIAREIIQVLCFGSMTFSQIHKAVPERMSDHVDFEDVLNTVAHYQHPDIAQEPGRFRLKSEKVIQVDPYFFHYDRNEREEARALLAKEIKKTPNLVMEPSLQPITDGIYENLDNVASSAILQQLVFFALDFIHSSVLVRGELPGTVLQDVAHLAILCTKATPQESSFAQRVVTYSFPARSLREESKTFLELAKIVHSSISTSEVRNDLGRLISRLQTNSSSDEDSEMLPDESISESDAAKRILAKERQQRAMAQMQQAQQNFWSQNCEDMSDDENVDVATQHDSMSTHWNFPKGTCIVCQEETGNERLFGTLSIIQRSNINRTMPLENPYWTKEGLRTPEVALEIPDVHSIEDLHARSFPSDNILKGANASSCGHLIHADCFDRFYNNILDRSHAQQYRNHPENTKRGEFLCPLCKRLGNAFIPIIWKGRIEGCTNGLQTKTNYEDWLNTVVAPAICRLEKGTLSSRKAVTRSSSSRTDSLSSRRFHDAMRSYMLENVSDVISDHLLTEAKIRYAFEDSDHGVEINARDRLESFLANFIANSSARSQETDEMVTKSYVHLQYLVSSQPTDSRKEIANIKEIWSLVSYTLSSVEASHRTNEISQDVSVLNKLNETTLSFMRILCETALSYSSIGSMQGPENSVVKELIFHTGKLLKQIFMGHPLVYEPDEGSAFEYLPLLQQDQFEVLVQVNMALSPTLQFEFHHLLRTIYMAKVCKIVLALGMQLNAEAVEKTGTLSSIIASSKPPNSDPESIILRFTRLLLIQSGCDGKLTTLGLQQVNEHLFLQVLEKLLVPFLRKSVLYAFARFQGPIPDANDDLSELPEIARLQVQLNLPSLQEIFVIPFREEPTTQPDDCQITRCLIFGWCEQLAQRKSDRFSPTPERPIRLAYPGLPDLIPLPQHFDILVQLCSNCCGDVGIFLVIKKSVLVYLFRTQGCFTATPYLDSHGETDLLLKRGRRLFLHQKRYETTVRNAWLMQMISTKVATHIEQNYDQGGWETF
ncbi:E3 ubiquitin-protein ligase ubr1 [Neolecta irregularis DAH-3]|uniref:E3 ubiquitin-protein ligase n=1 Tax=Neolecta irregularis (strain DAH-3) TaxID=1198029 RepID=A0A1U7LUU8_NEOID|nr:E3 ubiquitin-protein ligase ubr1 [Neolecta irregularis DAH-3]|eukprot:OLL26450.1 E3 ubiquitin-protein ligase ubr1 [Neolecta irregularis DAH-3]